MTASPAHELAASLDAALDNHEAKPGFIVDDLDSAEWAARKLAQINDRIAEVERIAADRRRTIDAWVAEATKADRESADYFEGLLKFYLQTEHRKNAKVKSIKLPRVDVASRAGTDKWEFDEGEFTAWAEAQGLTSDDPDAEDGDVPVLVKVERTIRVAEAKKVLTFGDDGVFYNGQPVLGVKVTPGDRTYSVKVKPNG